MGRQHRRPGLEGSGDGRGELCLSLALALHAAVIDVALLRSLAPPPARPAKVERTVDVDLEQRAAVVEPPVVPPPPEPPPPPKPAQAPAADPDDPFAAARPPGPAPMEAAKIVTAEGAGDRPAIVSGNAVGSSYGFVSADGRGTAPTFDVEHGGGGPAGGRAWGRGRETGAGMPPPPPVDRSRAAHVVGSYTDTCPFPPEADVGTVHVDHAVVMVSVRVRPDGKAQAAQAVSDPGHGFAREATRCAMLQSFIPALDAAGTPIWTPSLVFAIRFTR